MLTEMPSDRKSSDAMIVAISSGGAVIKAIIVQKPDLDRKLVVD